MIQPRSTEHDRVVQALVHIARAATGFDDAAVSRDAIARLADRLLWSRTADDIIDACGRREASMMVDVVRACIVNETYLFRQPDHFSFVEEGVVPGLLERATQAPIRAWSAGCATGEEAWSLAACLHHAAAGLADVDILATDLVADHVAAGRAGVCRNVARRANAHGPERHRVFEQAGPVPRSVGDEQGGIVRAELRRLVRFAVHDLRDPPLAKDFDLVLCRNVLMFLSRAAAARALAHLTSSLAPGGVLILGPVDTAAAVPVGLEPFGPPALSAFRRPCAHAAPSTPARPASPFQPMSTGSFALEQGMPPPTSLQGPQGRPPGPAIECARVGGSETSAASVDAHARALGDLEKGDLDGAMRHLGEAMRSSPGYVPALVERALLLDRAGDRAGAEAAMREALARLATLADDEIVVGPEPLPARFWAASAHAFFARAAGRGAVS